VELHRWQRQMLGDLSEKRTKHSGQQKLQKPARTRAWHRAIVSNKLNS
jgi:hypothetical protein